MRFARKNINVFVCHAVAFVEEAEFCLLRRPDDEDAVALMGLEVELMRYDSSQEAISDLHSRALYGASRR